MAQLLSNDIDPDGDVLRILDFDASGTLGSVSFIDGQFYYSAAGAFDHLLAGEVAEDRFRYRVADPDGLVSEAEVVIAVAGVAVRSVPVVIHATGSGGPVAMPEFAVFADGVEIGSGRISVARNVCLVDIAEGSPLYERFEFTAGPDLPDSLEIRFANNGRDPVSGRDLDLSVDRIEIGDRTYQSEKDGWFVALKPVFSGHDGYRETLFVNGSLHFDDLG